MLVEKWFTKFIILVYVCAIRGVRTWKFTKPIEYRFGYYDESSMDFQMS